MSAAQHEQPSATQSAADITSREDDVIDSVSGSGGTVKSLHRAASDAYPAAASGAVPRTRDERRSPTAGGRRGRGLSKPVEVTHSAPEAAVAAPTAATAAVSRPVADLPHGDHPQSSDSDDQAWQKPTFGDDDVDKENREQTKKKKKQSTKTSSWKRQQPVTDDCANAASNTVVIHVPRIINPSLADSSAASTLENSQGMESQKEPSAQGHETTFTHSRRRRADNDDPAQHKAKSEGQTPTACEDRSRISKTSSFDLDQLRLQFQRQRSDADDLKTELDDLRKMLQDAQKRFSAEREGRRKLEEWTEYLEHELQVYLKSRKNDEQRYMKLLGAAKDVDKFMKYVVKKYDKLHRQLESSCDHQSSAADNGGDCSKDSDASDKVPCVSGSSSTEATATSGQRTTARDRAAVPLIRSPASSNESDQLNKNSSSSNSGVDGASTSSKSLVVADTSRKRKQSEHGKEPSVGPGGSVSAARNAGKERDLTAAVQRSRRRVRVRNNSNNASTQTHLLPTVDELDDDIETIEDTTAAGHSAEKTCGVTELNKEEIRACVVDILRLMLAPVLTDDQGSGSTPTDSRAHASEPSRAAPPTQAPTRRSHSPAVITTSTAAVPRYSGHPSYRYPYRPYQYQYYRHPYHHMHHHHHTHQQYAQHQRRRPTESNANQHNRHPTSHSYPSNCASCNMLNVDFVDTVHFKTVRGSTLQAHSSFSHSQHGATCPHRAVRGRPIVQFGRFSSTSTSSVAPRPATPWVGQPPAASASSPAAAETAEALPEEKTSDDASDGRRPLTEEALRQRVERVLVEMVSQHDKDDDSKDARVAAALRQAIVDSAAFPTLFSD